MTYNVGGKLFVPDKKLHLLYGKGMVINPDGSIAEELDWERNTLADEGEQSVLEVYLRQQSNPDKWLGLLTNAGDPTETSTLAALGGGAAEQVGNGYARQPFTAGGGDWGATALNAGDYQTTAAEKTFGPVSGSSWTIKHAFVTTTVSGTSGKFILWMPLSGVTTVNVAQSFKYTLSVKAQ